MRPTTTPRPTPPQKLKLRILGSGTILISEAWVDAGDRSLRRPAPSFTAIRAQRVQRAPEPSISAAVLATDATAEDQAKALARALGARRGARVAAPPAPIRFFDGAEGYEVVTTTQATASALIRQRHVIRAVDGELHYLVASVPLRDEAADAEARRALSTYDPIRAS
ncbi:MAG: hypothetical protein HYV07_14470 [Deltaproteobacteria bacterium]|nr:hypothetical protein [Deltaproteobacteria bacterium]